MFYIIRIHQYYILSPEIEFEQLFRKSVLTFIFHVFVTGFLPNQGNQGNIREFYFDLKYQGKIREKRKKIGNQGKIREIFLILLITLQKILMIVFNFFNHII